jgi:chromosome segregation ATPase
MSEHRNSRLKKRISEKSSADMENRVLSLKRALDASQAALSDARVETENAKRAKTAAEEAGARALADAGTAAAEALAREVESARLAAAEAAKSAENAAAEIRKAKARAAEDAGDHGKMENVISRLNAEISYTELHMLNLFTEWYKTGQLTHAEAKARAKRLVEDVHREVRSCSRKMGPKRT